MPESAADQRDAQARADGLRFNLEGLVTFRNLAQLRGEGERFISDASGDPVFSLTNVAGGSSAAVALMMAWFRHARHLGKNVVFVDVPENLRNIIEVSGLTDVLPVQAATERGQFPAAAPVAESVQPEPDPSTRDQ